MSKIGSGMSGMRKPEGLEPPCRASYPDSLRHKADISYIEDTDKEMQEARARNEPELTEDSGNSPLQKGGVPAAPSGTATLLRLSPNHRFRPRPTLAATDFRRPRLSWLDGRCVQGPGTYSPRHG